MATSRQIDTPITSPRDYLDRIGQIVPAEITAAFLAIQPLLIDAGDITLHFPELLVFTAFLTALTPLYLRKFFGVTNAVQLVISGLSFPVWAGAICAEQLIIRSEGLISNVTITLVMVGWALIIPLFVPARPQPVTP